MRNALLVIAVIAGAAFAFAALYDGGGQAGPQDGASGRTVAPGASLSAPAPEPADAGQARAAAASPGAGDNRAAEPAYGTHESPLAGAATGIAEVPSAARGVDPADLAREMSREGPFAAPVRPPSGGPSTLDRGLAGPASFGPGADSAGTAGAMPAASDFGIAAAAADETQGPGPSQTDLGLPGPGEGLQNP